MVRTYPNHAFTVGQKVIVYGVNFYRDGIEGEVTRVGRTLVGIKFASRRAHDFRIKDRRINDKYEHYWFQTLPEYAEQQRREVAAARAKELTGENWDYISNKISISQLERIVRILEDS